MTFVFISPCLTVSLSVIPRYRLRQKKHSVKLLTIESSMTQIIDTKCEWTTAENPLHKTFSLPYTGRLIGSIRAIHQWHVDPFVADLLAMKLRNRVSRVLDTGHANEGEARVVRLHLDGHAKDLWDGNRRALFDVYAKGREIGSTLKLFHSFFSISLIICILSLCLKFWFILRIYIINFL